jgi:hypothetical protein
MQTPTAITWFEIPATDLSRAQTFYETILGTTLKRAAMGDAQMAMFPYEEPGIGGCVVLSNGYRPARDGAVVYLQAGAQIDAVLNRVSPAGGQVALPKTALPEGMGFYAHIIDTEGNRVGLHALQ